MRDFFPKIGTPAVKRTRKPVTDQFPTVVYTDPQCLQIIEERDKDANASYVKEFQWYQSEAKPGIDRKQLIRFRDMLFGLGTW